MKLKAIVYSLGGVVALLSMGLAAPRAAHAVAAALVQVANTTANPVPTTEMSRQANQTVEIACNAYTPGYGPPCVQLNSQGGNIGNFTIPAGQQFVLTDVDATMIDSTNVGGQTGIIFVQDGTSREIWYFPNGGPTTQMHFNSGIAIAAGQQLEIESLANPNVTPRVLMHGYLTAN